MVAGGTLGPGQVGMHLASDVFLGAGFSGKLVSGININ